MKETSDGTPVLLGSAYDLSSGGIGVQIAIVQALMGEREFNDWLDGNLDAGIGSNLLGSPATLATFYPENWPESEYRGYFGNRTEEFRTRYLALRQSADELERIIVRSSIRKELVENDRDYTHEEFSELMDILFGRKLKTEEHGGLYESRHSPMQFGGVLVKHGLPDKRFDNWRQSVFKYLKSSELYQRVLKFHAEKLDLMADIFHTDLEKSGASRDIKPQSPDNIWELNWKRLFGQEMPTAYKLVENAKETVSRAGQFYK